MKLCIVCCLLLSASALHDEVIKAKWAAFKAKHGKEYHPSEEATRLNNFLKATVDIETHNERYHRGEVSYKLGHNHFSDLSHDEFKSTYLGRERMDSEVLNVTEVTSIASDYLPKEVSWKRQRILTPIKWQRRCASCYAFGVIGVVEALLRKRTNKTYDLSEQQIVDCTYHINGQSNGGCRGGHEITVMNYISDYGLVRENAYPYKSGVTNTNYACNTRHNRGRFGKYLMYRRIALNETELAYAVAQYGPVVIAMSGENQHFKQYRGGIYDNPACLKTPNHLISIVGYGRKHGKDYWLVRNSWGKHWGERGYGKRKRGVNQCGLITDHPYAITDVGSF